MKGRPSLRGSSSTGTRARPTRASLRDAVQFHMDTRPTKPFEGRGHAKATAARLPLANDLRPPVPVYRGNDDTPALRVRHETSTDSSSTLTCAVELFIRRISPHADALPSPKLGSCDAVLPGRREHRIGKADAPVHGSCRRAVLACLDYAYCGKRISGAAAKCVSQLSSPLLRSPAWRHSSQSRSLGLLRRRRRTQARGTGASRKS